MRNRHMRKPAELLLVPMIDIFTVLVTFLLMTAVFSRITVVELDLPSAADGPAVTEPQFRLEVILREEGFELTNGSSVIARRYLLRASIFARTFTFPPRSPSLYSEKSAMPPVGKSG